MSRFWLETQGSLSVRSKPCCVLDQGKLIINLVLLSLAWIRSTCLNLAWLSSAWLNSLWLSSICVSLANDMYFWPQYLNCVMSRFWLETQGSLSVRSKPCCVLDQGKLIINLVLLSLAWIRSTCLNLAWLSSAWLNSLWLSSICVSLANDMYFWPQYLNCVMSRFWLGACLCGQSRAVCSINVSQSFIWLG